MARAFSSGVVLLSLLALSPAARAAETWEQKAEKQPSGADAAPAPVSKGLADWIWGPPPTEKPLSRLEKLRLQGKQAAPAAK